jgi:ketosteroid isomerase-like protein
MATIPFDHSITRWTDREEWAKRKTRTERPMTNDEKAVLEANDAFYAAFAARDAEAMNEAWAKRAPAACVHPGWSPLRGRDEVIDSWRGILGGSGAPPITCSRATAHVLGDSAYVICIEHVPGGLLVATNLFVREDARWRIVHHHAGPLMRPIDEPDPPQGETVH